MKEHRGRPRKNKIDKFKQQIMENFYNALEEMAQVISEQVQEAYTEVIDDFYNFAAFPYKGKYGIDYTNTPNSYNRTFSLYRASSGYHDLYSSVWNYGDYVEGGIEVAPENIGYNPYRADTDWVFNRSFFEGIHGFYSKSKTGKNWLIKKYRNKFRKKGSKEMGFSFVAPLKNKPIPKEFMDKKFKKITTKKALDQLFEETIKKHLS